jgi:type IV pilus biogenesis protein PilP
VVANAIVQREASRLSASLDYQAPDTSNAIEAALEPDAAPARPTPETTVRRTPQVNIPSSASVARQATIANAIQLNKINLVGVYGAPSDRRALVRLPSGRYLKVKVGDRVDGGTVARITERELLYRKGSRTLSLALPKG